MSTCLVCKKQTDKPLVWGACYTCYYGKPDECQQVESLLAELAALRTDRDELHATLSGLCSFLGAGTPDATTPAVEINRMIHAGIKRREDAARDEVRQFLRGLS